MAGGSAAGTRRLDRRANAGAAMRRQIVHQDEIARLERWHQYLFDIGQEGIAVHRAVEDHGRGQAAKAQSTSEGSGLPMTMRDGRPTTLSAFGAAAEPGHLGGCTGLVDEDQTLGIEIRLRVEPSLAPRGDVGPLLFAGVRRFF
jgi:hypothetical protein